MKKLLSVLLTFALALSISACGTNKQTSDKKDVNNTSNAETFASNENAQLFFDEVIENKKHIDPLFSLVCGTWKAEESKSGATVSDVNKAIKGALSQHSSTVTMIDEADQNIAELYELAKKCPASANVEAVMTAYKAYKISVLNADASTNPGGYKDASAAKASLDKALRNLRSTLSQ